MKKLWVCGAAALWLMACGGDKAETKSGRKVGMSVEEAKGIVAQLEEQQAKNSTADPLRAPKSKDDLLAILKRDEIDLFASGVQYATSQQDDTSLQLRAQIELAWGEAHLILSELFQDAAVRLRQSLRTMNTRDAISQDPAQQAQLAEIKKTIEQCDTVSEALSLTAAEHVASGAKLAQDVIAKNPTDYVGYRLAADFYRLRGEWAKFDEMIKKIEETNPDSNGLVFLRGAALLQRDGKPNEAAAMFRTALERDKDFTRAQAQLVLSRLTIDETYGELMKLKEKAPNHQIVVWAGPAITAAHNAHQAARKGTGAGATNPQDKLPGAGGGKATNQ